MSDKLLVTPEMSLEEAWKCVKNRVRESVTDAGHPFRYVTLATVDKYNSPQQRIVVLRNFAKDSEFTIYTDSRSGKVNQITENDSVSLLFYDNDKRLQLRATGSAEIIKTGEEYNRNWKNNGSKNPRSYTSVVPPGREIKNPEEAYHWDLKSSLNFCLIRVRATRMEFLQLDGAEHIRAEKIIRDRGEIIRWIAP